MFGINRVSMPVAGHHLHNTNRPAPPTLPSSLLPLRQNHPRSPVSNSAERCVVRCQAKSRRHAAGTRVTVPFVGWLASSGTIVANPRLRRGAAGASSRCVGSSSSNPSPCWRPLGIVEPRPQTRSCRRISRRLRRGSIAAREKSGNCECHDLRDARPLALEYSFGSFPNRCLPIVAITFRWESLSAAESLFHPKFRVFRLFRLVRVASLAL